MAVLGYSIHKEHKGGLSTIRCAMVWVQSTVYPIPSSGRITVEYPEGAERIVIYDLTGKLSYHRALDGKEGILDISLTQAGVYQLQVLKAKDEMEVRKIVIVK